MAKKKPPPVDAARARKRQAPSAGLDVHSTGRGAYTAFGYRSASDASKDGRAATPGSGDHHQQTDRERLVNQARDFGRNNGIFSGMTERATSYVVGNGFGLQAKTEDPKYNTQAESLWNEFWERPEIRGIESGPSLEQLVCNEIMTAGDVGVIKTSEKLLQVIESEQIKGPGALSDGIKKNKWGRPTSFWVSPYGKSGAPEVSRAQEYSAEDFLFITNPKRPSATRSVPPCQASFPMLHRISDVCDSSAVGWQLQARLVMSVNRANGPLLAPTDSRSDENLAGMDTEGRAATRVREFDYGTFFEGEPGDEIKGIERTVPGKNFTEDVTMMLRLMGLPLGLPIEIILLDWTKSNYSQSRAVLEQAYVTFRKWQTRLRSFFHTPVYRWFIDLCVSSGKLKSRPDMYAHEWIRPSFPWIDQLKEAQAYGAKVDRSFCTHAQVLKSLDQDRDEVVAAREREIRDAIARAQAIEKETGVKVPWETFAGMAPPVSVPVAPPQEEEEKQDEEEEEAPKPKGTVKTVHRDGRGNILRVVEKPYTGDEE
jgi:capsid protein